MKNNLLFIGTLVLLLLLSCGTHVNKVKEESIAKTSTTKVLSNKEIVIKGMDALFRNFDEQAMRAFYTQDYIQHNPKVPTGLDPIMGMLPVLKAAKLDYTLHRIIEEGDLVLTHTSYHNAEIFGAKEVVAFDIWRVENGKIAEHWDAIMPKFEESASGRTQADGATKITDLAKTEANKKLVKSFATEVLVNGNMDKMGTYFKGNTYDQHNPFIVDGWKGLKSEMEAMAAKNNALEWHKIHRVIGEGNFVLVQTEGEWSGKPQAIYDLFRVSDGFIVEHWDVIQEIPDQAANTNGMFGQP